MKKSIPKNKTISQKGFVSFVVCITIASLLTLISLSFVAIINREQRQALDRQLSAQALYAAESGINYAIRANIADTGEDCEERGAVGSGPFSYTCVIVDSSPPILVFNNVGTLHPTTFYTDDNGGNVKLLRFKWDNANTDTEHIRAGTDYSSGPRFFPASCWDSNNCTADGTPSIGVLEVTVYPLGGGPGFNINDVRNNSRTYYLYPGATVTPTSTSGSAAYSDDGRVVNGNCSTTAIPKCTAIIGTSPSPLPPSTAGYIIKMRSIYNNLTVNINGRNAGDTMDVDLLDAQKVIDATGKASDVLRRVRVHLPLSGGYDLPSFAIETAGGLCKRQGVYPGGGTEDSLCE